jgi:hypothetical protein
MKNQTLSKIAKELGKLGGEARKKQNPDYSAMGKKGGWPKGKARKKKGDK